MTANNRNALARKDDFGLRQLALSRHDFGEIVRRLVDESGPPTGLQSVTWGFRNDSGEMLAPGFYIYRITVDDESESRIFLKLS